MDWSAPEVPREPEAPAAEPAAEPAAAVQPVDTQDDSCCSCSDSCCSFLTWFCCCSIWSVLFAVFVWLASRQGRAPPKTRAQRPTTLRPRKQPSRARDQPCSVSLYPPCFSQNDRRPSKAWGVDPPAAAGTRRSRSSPFLTLPPGRPPCARWCPATCSRSGTPARTRGASSAASPTSACPCRPVPAPQTSRSTPLHCGAPHAATLPPTRSRASAATATPVEWRLARPLRPARDRQERRAGIPLPLGGGRRRLGRLQVRAAPPRAGACGQQRGHQRLSVCACAGTPPGEALSHTPPRRRRRR